MGRDELLLFEGVELEEPSRAVDEAILALAGERLRTSVRGKPGARRRAWAHLGLAAGLAIGLLFLWPASRPPPSLRGAGSETARAPIEEIRELRMEIDQINEMSELIPPEKEAEREAIVEKIKFCLADLDALEERLLRFDQGSLEGVRKKEAKI